MNPSHAGFLAEMSAALVCVGRVDEAITQVERAIRINSNFPEWFLAYLGWACYESGRYDEALDALNRMNNSAAVFQPLFIATLVELGRIGDARVAALELLAEDPAFTLGVLGFWPYKDQSRRLRLAEDLRTAGVPG